MRSLRLLVVDDSRAFGLVVARELRALGHHVDVESDSERAVRACAEHAYDVVLCDLVMPKLDGQDVLEQVMCDHPEVRFVLMSGHLEPTDILVAHRAGAAGYLRKPFGRPELAELLERITAEPGALAPERLRHAVDLLARPHPSAEDVLRHFGDDSELAMLAAEPALGGPGGSLDLAATIESAGSVRVLTLAATLGIREVYDAAAALADAQRSAVWRVHCTTSLVACALAARQGIGQADRVQLMVLLTQIGELTVIEEEMRQDPLLWHGDGRPARSLVRAVHEGSAPAAVVTLAAWKLPEGLVRLARTLADDPTDTRGLAGLATNARHATLTAFDHYPFAPRGVDPRTAIPGASPELVHRLLQSANTQAEFLKLG